jgi:hypothetical protein
MALSKGGGIVTYSSHRVNTILESRICRTIPQVDYGWVKLCLALMRGVRSINSCTTDCTAAYKLRGVLFPIKTLRYPVVEVERLLFTAKPNVVLPTFSSVRHS